MRQGGLCKTFSSLTLLLPITNCDRHMYTETFFKKKIVLVLKGTTYN